NPSPDRHRQTSSVSVSCSGVQTRDGGGRLLLHTREGQMDEADRLRLDYEQTTQLMRTLADIRFKLLAFVPTVSGAVVALFSRPRSAAELLAIGLLRLFATVGILLYELRNAQLLGAAVRRATAAERKLGLSPMLDTDGPRGGLFTERPRRMLTLFGLVEVRHARGLGFVYGAALAGWTYLVVWGALRALDVGAARKIGGVAGLAVGLVVAAEVQRLGPRAAPPH